MEPEGSQMSADSCGVAEICLWNWKEEKLTLEKKNSTFARIRVFWYTGTMQRSIVCSLLLSFLRTRHSLFCCRFGSTFLLWPNANVLNMRLDRHPSCCAGCWQITAMAMCCFATARVCSDQKVFSFWSIGIFPYYLVNFPYESCYAIFVWGIPSFPPPELLRMWWSREEGFRGTECFKAAVSEWRKVVCVFQDAAELVHQCLLIGKQRDFFLVQNGMRSYGSSISETILSLMASVTLLDQLEWENPFLCTSLQRFTFKALGVF